MHNPADLKDLAQSYRALADETRLQILGLILHKGELCVCDVVYALDITQSKASRHLRYLLNAGFLRDRREGVWMHYRIPDALHPERRAMLDTVKSHLSQERLAPLLTRLNEWKKPIDLEIQYPEETHDESRRSN